MTTTPTTAKIVLKHGKDRPLRRFHPWVFSGAIERMEGEAQEGDIVKVYSADREFLALGHLYSGTIAIKAFAFEETEPTSDFWQERLANAIALRKSFGMIDSNQTTGFRLVHGESDGLPGLIIDIYDQVAVIQFHTLGMYLIRQELVQGLRALLGDKLSAIYAQVQKGSGMTPENLGTEGVSGYLWRNDAEKALSGHFKENGLTFKADWEHGQKTGFFLDQRENRKLLSRYAQDREVLNAFSYSGAFSVYALSGKAKSVTSLDSSKPALELATQNVALNFNNANHKTVASDCMDYLLQANEQYDMIVLDPPAFAKNQSSLENALRAYRRINHQAIKNIRKGGIVFTFSCSQHVSKENFREMVFSASAETKRTVKVLYQLEQGPDHPVSIYHPEGEYLKGLVLAVD